MFFITLNVSDKLTDADDDEDNIKGLFGIYGPDVFHNTGSF